MDAWRIGVVIATACFVVFLLVKMRPRGPAARAEAKKLADRKREQRVERRILTLAAQLSPAALKRLRDELDRRIRDIDDSAAAEAAAGAAADDDADAAGDDSG
jgi:hypothetical protein